MLYPELRARLEAIRTNLRDRIDHDAALKAALETPIETIRAELDAEGFDEAASDERLAQMILEKFGPQ